MRSCAVSHRPTPDPATIDLPTEPPVDCVDTMLWTLARRIREDHQRGIDLFCVICRPHEMYPCAAARLATKGMRSACASTTGVDAIEARRSRR